MKMQNKIKIFLTVLFGAILLTKTLVAHFIPNLTFINGELVIATRIIVFLLFLCFIMCVFMLFKPNEILVMLLGIVLFLIFFVYSCSEIYPIDTTTQPKDILILETYEDGTKLILRERISMKRNIPIQDKVLVKDNFIFRQIISPENESQDKIR